MNKFIYRMHLWLGMVAAVPLLAWSLSGLLYAMPNMVEGGTVDRIYAGRIKIAPAQEMESANALAGRTLPTTALTLLMRDGRPQYQSIGGLGPIRYLSMLKRAKPSSRRRHQPEHDFSAKLISIILRAVGR